MLWILIHLVEYIKLILDDENVSHVLYFLLYKRELSILNEKFPYLFKNVTYVE